MGPKPERSHSPAEWPVFANKRRCVVNQKVGPASTLVPNPIPALIGKASGSIGQATITALNAQQPYLALLGQTVLASKGNSDYDALQVHALRESGGGAGHQPASRV